VTSLEWAKTVEGLSAQDCASKHNYNETLSENVIFMYTKVSEKRHDLIDIHD
jgi:hypothetical protein